MCKGSGPGAAGEADAGRDAAPASIGSAELLQGQREVLIHHAGQTYRLRVTASNKLILIK
jgi:hemin uptake protein HemP